MKQKFVLLIILMIVLAMPRVAVAYDFSAVAPSGQTLYYNIIGRNVQVTYPLFSNHDYYYGYTKPTGNLSIPDSVLYGGNTYLVTSIDSSAFYGCSGLLSVTIPKFVTHLGFLAFGNCSNLTIVNFNADSCVQAGYADEFGTDLSVFSGCRNLSTIKFGNSVKTIPPYLCYGLTALASVIIGDSVTSIGEEAFFGCRRLTSITIPNAVTTIWRGAFSYCSGLTTVYFNADSCISVGIVPNSYSYGNETPVFDNCTNLSTINFGNNVKRIPNKLCCGWSGLTSIEIPNSTKMVGKDTFRDCDHLTNIVLGTGLSTIADFAFYGCTQIVRIKTKSVSPPTVYSNTFLGLRDDVILNTPCNAVNAYENAAYWFRFNIQEDLMLDFSATSSNPARGTVTIVTEPTCDYREAQVQANAYHGYHFDHWSDGNTDNPRYIVVLQDTHLVAYFASDNGEEGIEETTEEGAKIYQSNGQIVVEGAEGSRVMVYDVYGRVLAVKRDDGGVLRFDVPAAGVYLVRVGDAPARKVAVVR